MSKNDDQTNKNYIKLSRWQESSTCCNSLLEFFSALLQTEKNCISQDGKNQAHAGTLQRAWQEYHDIHSIFAVSTTTLRNDGQQRSQPGKIAYPHWLLRD